MVSERQVEANRQNALKSTGPRTPEGKAAVAANAMKHGILSALKVLPGLERQQDWQAHLEQTRADLRPEGYVEQALAERVALLLWRLGRVARFERNAAATGFENAEREVAVSELRWQSDEVRKRSALREAGKKIEATREYLRRLEGLPELPEDAPVFWGAEIFEEARIAVAGGLAGDHETCPEFVAARARLHDLGGSWTAGYIRKAMRGLAREKGMSFDQVLEKLTSRVKERLAQGEKEKKALASMLRQHRQMSMLPGDAQLEKVRRHESHLERALYKALEELRRLQAARQGRPVPPAVALDVNVSGVQGN